ncbi:hypothetical protein WA588_005637, partial [Blastocystis sp. NMH]
EDRVWRDEWSGWREDGGKEDSSNQVIVLVETEKLEGELAWLEKRTNSRQLVVIPVTVPKLEKPRENETLDLFVFLQLCSCLSIQPAVYQSPRFFPVTTDWRELQKKTPVFSYSPFRGTLPWQFLEDGGSFSLVLFFPADSRAAWEFARQLNSRVPALSSLFPPIQSLFVNGVVDETPSMALEFGPFSDRNAVSQIPLRSFSPRNMTTLLGQLRCLWNRGYELTSFE